MKIFRKKRMRLIREGKLQEYLLYSIGEVALLVIGILIAMKVNNINAKSKADDQVRATLIALQKDLKENIKSASNLLEWNNTRDSIISEILDKKVTKEMYQQGKIGSLHTSYNYAVIIDENLKKILQFEDHLGEQYSSLLSELKTYSSSIGGEKEVNKLFSDYALEQGRHLTYNHSWFYDFMTGNPSEEAIDYFMNDPFYFNRLAFYNVLMVNNQSSFVSGRRNFEVLLINSIEKVLNQENPKKLKDILENNGWVSCIKLNCQDEIAKDTTFLSYTRPFMANTLEDTVYLVLKTKNGEFVRNFQIPPNDNLSQRIPDEAIIERLENNECTERYQTAANTYLLFE